MPCAQSQHTPTYDDAFFAEIEKCPKSPAAAYCDCYDLAALRSQIRKAQADVSTAANAASSARQAYHDAVLKQTPIAAPPLNVPSRANQKKNTFSKIFNPQTRKMLVLLIAAFLIFLAVTNYD